MSTEIEVNNCFVIFATINEHFLVEGMLNLKTFSQLLLNYFNVVFSILKYKQIPSMWNVKFNHKILFLRFVYSNKEK